MNLNFEPGAHVCHLYSGDRELKEVALPFIRDGLNSGESCIYVADVDSVDDWYLEFQAYGIDVRSARDTGALDVITAGDWRNLCQCGSLVMARAVIALMQQELGRFPSVRIAGDSAWNREPFIPPDQLCHWEATANFVFEGLNANIICQYDLGRYEPEFIHAALRTHSMVLYQGRRVVNPYYEAAVILEQEPLLNRSSSDPNVIAAMLAHFPATDNVQ